MVPTIEWRERGLPFKRLPSLSDRNAGVDLAARKRVTEYNIPRVFHGGGEFGINLLVLMATVDRVEYDRAWASLAHVLNGLGPRDPVPGPSPAALILHDVEASVIDIDDYDVWIAGLGRPSHACVVST